MQDIIKQLKTKALADIKRTLDSEALKGLETKYIGRKGEFTALLKQISGLSDEDKRRIGALANQAKQEIIAGFKEAREIVLGQSKAEFADLTLPGTKRPAGHLNPITRLSLELEKLFSSMGFMILDGPELESEYYNFEALNIPAYHPARDMQDTFFVDWRSPGAPKAAGEKQKNGLVMRTHTSSVQIRAMQEFGAPLRCVSPGRVYRAEATDAVHEHTFYQMEGLMIDKGISLANLVAVMTSLVNAIFGREVETRVRPGYFPFVEPGIELDIRCTICGGLEGGCKSCKHSGWLEILPAGMVHPNVMKHGGLDPGQYSGFAFGLGLTRLAMMKYGIDDIRHFMGGDSRFIEQF